MKVLIISDLLWSDKEHPNDVTTNWFTGSDMEFANIYCAPGKPYNNICKKYFQITDKMMFKSLYTKKKAGEKVDITENEAIISGEEKNESLYRRLKQITTHTLRFIREMIWTFAKYDEKKLKEFIDEFNPDIIFTIRFASLKMLRLEKKVMELSGKPIVAYTGDDEFSLDNIEYSPMYWLKRIMTRNKLKKQLPKYSLYYMHSEEQKEVYEKLFKVESKIIYKCGDFNKDKTITKLNDPIRIVYAGKLYCNRWKTLVMLAEEIKIYNKNNGKKYILEIYTKDIVTKKQKRLLNDNENTFIKGAVTVEELNKIYSKSDICLHVESLDKKNKILTKHSFSTKLIDCLSSGCAIMAITWEKHAGMIYLKENKNAICITKREEIYENLQRLDNDRNLIFDYAKKAYEVGAEKHSRKIVQESMKKDFQKIIKES